MTSRPRGHRRRRVSLPCADTFNTSGCRVAHARRVLIEEDDAAGEEAEAKRRLSGYESSLDGSFSGR